jgi:hypothetical protein
MSTLSSSVSAQTERASAANWASYPPEFRLLLACCQSSRERRGTIVGEAISSGSIQGNIDWDRALALGDHHGVLPAMHEALCAGSVDEGTASRVPQAAREELERRFAFITRKNLRLAAELIHVLDCLDAGGIAAIPYKGPVLAETAYGDLALRDFSDLDVLVRAGDVSRAKDALARIAYKPNITLSAVEERAYVASGYEYTFDGPAGKNLLEIQWNFVPRFFAVDFDMEAVLARARSGLVAGRAVRMLAPEDLFLALCVHAAKHVWGRLCWLRDIAAVGESRSLDWERVRTESKQLGVGRIVDVSLALAHDLLGAEVPHSGKGSAVRQDDAEVRTIAGEIAQHIPNAEEYSTESLHYFRWMLRLRERSADRWRFASRLLLTPSVGEWNLVKIPEPLFPLYRGIRLLRVGGRVLGLRS